MTTNHATSLSHSNVGIIIGMTKAGRKRKLKSKRQPSGKSNSWENPRAVCMARRISDQIERQVSHPHYGFPLGLLHATKFITDAEFDAGQAWARLTFRFGQVMGIAMPVPKAVNWEGARGADLGAGPTNEEAARIKAEKARQDGIIATTDTKGMRLMIECCIEDRPPWAPSRLKKVLEALAEFRASGHQARRKERA
jgi:hypothetical protein